MLLWSQVGTDKVVTPKHQSSLTLVCFGPLLCPLLTGRPPVVYAWEGAISHQELRSVLTTIHQFKSYPTGGPFSHHPSVIEAVALHINGANGLTTGTRRSPHSTTLPCILSLPPPPLLIPLPSLPWPPVSISPVFGFAAGLSINHLSYHCDVLRPHWGSLCYDLALSWFRAEWYFVCQWLCQSHTIRTQQVFQPALDFLLSFHAREWN